MRRKKPRPKCQRCRRFETTVGYNDIIYCDGCAKPERQCTCDDLAKIPNPSLAYTERKLSEGSL